MQTMVRDLVERTNTSLNTQTLSKKVILIVDQQSSRLKPESSLINGNPGTDPMNKLNQGGKVMPYQG